MTVDSITHPLQRPFMVVATQNPIDSEGTFALPEAQRDRFMGRISMGYPRRDDELAMLGSHHRDEPLQSLAPVLQLEELVRMIEQVKLVTVTDRLSAYVVDLGEPRASTRRCSWALRRARCCSGCAPPSPTPRSPGGTTCCPRTCARWRKWCSATG